MAYKLTVKFSRITVWKVMQIEIIRKNSPINRAIVKCGRSDFKKYTVIYFT